MFSMDHGITDVSGNLDLKEATLSKFINTDYTFDENEIKSIFITVRKRSNVFTPVCQSFCSHPLPSPQVDPRLPPETTTAADGTGMHSCFASTLGPAYKYHTVTMIFFVSQSPPCPENISLSSLIACNTQGSQRSGKSGKILKTFSSQGNQGKTGGFQPKSGKKFQIMQLFFPTIFKPFKPINLREMFVKTVKPRRKMFFLRLLYLRSCQEIAIFA